jgi:hypothetical protein
MFKVEYPTWIDARTLLRCQQHCVTENNYKDPRSSGINRKTYRHNFAT